MRWYSFRQVLLMCIGTALLTLGIAFGVNFIVSDKTDRLGVLSGGGPPETIPGGFPGPDARSVNSATTQTNSSDEENNIAIYQASNEAVVNISTEVMYQSFFDQYSQEGDIGSGSIIDKRGYILTNNHVVKNASKVYVTLANGERQQGTVIGVDAENDLAVVKIDPQGKDLKTIPLGNSSGLKVGQKVLAIGNPFAYDQTLTTGIVSGLGRPVKNNDTKVVIRNMIQTDASINPGNSGGPLLDSKGNLIGINTMIISGNGGNGSVGIGFAVPVDTARRVVPELIANGKVRRGWIDAAPIQLFPELISYARLPVRAGLLLSRVEGGSNAALAGLKGGERSKGVRYGRTVIYLGGDIIVEVAGQAIETIGDLYTALEDKKPGDAVKVVYYRGKNKQETSVKLTERPASYNLE